MLSVADIDPQAAARRLHGRVARTPLEPLSLFANADGDVRAKLEIRQETGSFKIRGAFNAVLHLIEKVGDARPRLVTASAGNHGRGLARAAGEAGLPLTVYVPRDAPRAKVDAIRASGAELRPCKDYDEAERAAKEHGARGEALFISPYSHPDVIAGAGTVGLEIVEDWPEVDTIVVPIGGGGLLSGIALAAHAAKPTPRIIGVEVEASPAFTRSLAAGHIVPIDVRPSLADGLTGNLDPDTVTFDIVREHVSQIAGVTEDELRAAIVALATREGLTVEPAGAVGVAALLAGKLDVRGQRVAIVLSGANIDAEKLNALLVDAEHQGDRR
jgi:threonine dehydratase